MWLLAYRSVPLSVPCVFWKFEVRERLGLKIELEVGELRSLAFCGTLATVHQWKELPHQCSKLAHQKFYLTFVVFTGRQHSSAI